MPAEDSRTTRIRPPQGLRALRLQRGDPGGCHQDESTGDGGDSQPDANDLLNRPSIARCVMESYKARERARHTEIEQARVLSKGSGDSPNSELGKPSLLSMIGARMKPKTNVVTTGADRAAVSRNTPGVSLMPTDPRRQAPRQRRRVRSPKQTSAT